MIPSSKTGYPKGFLAVRTLCAILIAAGVIAVGLITTGLAAPAAQAAESLAAANADLQAGDADKAAALLSEALKADSRNAEAENLLCRVEYSTQHFDQAASDCQKAVDLSGQNAGYHHWLGRALGERASRAAFLSAFSLAKRTREQFETAISLDPHDADALADLGEFYTEAPSVVGGGTDKANDIAKKLDVVEPSRGHQLHAMIAEQAKDFDSAEREFKAACIGPRAAIQWMELASFYRRRQRWTDLDAAVKSGVAAIGHDRDGAIALYEGANILARANRQTDLAIKLYEQYLASPNKSEAAPAFDALARLARLRKRTGDLPGAQRDQAAALALAHDYKPAQAALEDSKHG